MLLAVLALSGCASILPTHSVDATVTASTDVNPNIYGRPSPVVVVFYQLKNINKFNGADFATLYQNPQKALGGDYLGQQQIEVAPGESGEVEFNLDKKAQYLGVVAAYSNLDSAIWRKTVKFESTWAAEKFTVHVKKNRVTVDYLL